MKTTLAFALLFSLATALHAEPYTCPEDIAAYDPKAPANQVGAFRSGTKVEIGKPFVGDTNFYNVTFMGSDGKFIAALCKAEDIGKAPRTTPRENQPPVIPTKKEKHYDWLEDYNEASGLSKSENKLLVMDFTGSDWCGWCMKLDSEVFSQPEFKSYAADNLILLKLDFPKKKAQSASLKQQNEQLAQQYGVRGFPTVIVLDSKGNKVGRLGYMEGGPAAFIAELKKLKP